MDIILNENPIYRILVIGSGGRETAIIRSLLLHNNSLNTLNSLNSDIVLDSDLDSNLDLDSEFGLDYRLEIYVFGSYRNPQIDYLIHLDSNTEKYKIDLGETPDQIANYYNNVGINMAIIGSENDLERGLSDALWKRGIKVIGPTSDLAKIETSKTWAREFLNKITNGSFNPQWRSFQLPLLPTEEDFENWIEEVWDWIDDLGGPGYFVLKWDGLCGGKGVLVSGIDPEISTFVTFREYLLSKNSDSTLTFIIEERLFGIEFSLITLTDGKNNCLHLPVVRDFKRAYNHNKGGNTGGMGCLYDMTDPNSHQSLIPIKNVKRAQMINKTVIEHLNKFQLDKMKLKNKENKVNKKNKVNKENNENKANKQSDAIRGYKGVLYGSFMLLDNNELKVIEYNARFGDPEIISLLNALNHSEIIGIDLFQIFRAIVSGDLNKIDENTKLRLFKPFRSMGYYLVPTEYPLKKVKTVIENEVCNFYEDPDIELDTSRFILAGINVGGDLSLETTGSRVLYFIDYFGAVDKETIQMCKTTPKNTWAVIDNLLRTKKFRIRTDLVKTLYSKYNVEKLTSEPLRQIIHKYNKNNINNDINSNINSNIHKNKNSGNKSLSTKSNKSLSKGSIRMKIDNCNKGNMDSKYKEAGVDIDEGNQVVEGIKKIERGNNIGSFGGMLPLKSISGYEQMDDPILVSSTDGIGTKVLLAAWTNLYNFLGADIVNHGINDILVQGAKPVLFLDYYGCGKLNSKTVLKIVKGIHVACTEANCRLVGGETAEMPGVYNDNSFDVVGTMVGIIDKKDLIIGKQMIKEGDWVFGLPSNGLHTNGFSLVRKVFGKERLQRDKDLTVELLKPHKSYLPEIRKMIDDWHINPNGLCHITGGGLIDNPPRILPDELTIEWIDNSWPIPKIFELIRDEGDIDNVEMFRVFNMGIGMLVIVNPEDAHRLSDYILRKELEAYHIGEVKHK